MRTIGSPTTSPECEQYLDPLLRPVVDDLLDRLGPLRSKVDQHRLDESPGASDSLLIGPDGGHHRISTGGHRSAVGAVGQ
jgi:hypothetical protein